MILSRTQIDEIGETALKEYDRCFPRKTSIFDTRPFSEVPIERFASSYLRLNVRSAHLSDDGRICGLTAYEDTMYEFREHGKTQTIQLHRNDILLDERFDRPENQQKLKGMRRFTLAHECAHQLLFQLENEAAKRACREKYEERRAYSLRELKTREDWNEWQANALAAALLMPRDKMALGVQYYWRGNPIKRFGGRFTTVDLMDIDSLAERLGVSRTAAMIRLKELRYIEERPSTEYDDPMNIEADKEFWNMMEDYLNEEVRYQNTTTSARSGYQDQARA